MDEEDGKIDSTRNYCSINRDLLPSKIAYFIFGIAFGCIRPFYPIYFKQLGITATQIGILMGCRPFMEAISTICFSIIADRLRCHKFILTSSLLLGAISTFTLSLPPLPKVHCGNDYPNYTTTIHGVNNARNETLINNTMYQLLGTVFVENDDFVVDADSLKRLFVYLLVIILVSEMFIAPAMTLLDTYSLFMLGNEKSKYGRQRGWAALGIGLGEILYGSALAYIMIKMDICGEIYLIGRDYRIPFSAYMVLIIATAMVTYNFQFPNVIQMNECHTEEKRNLEEFTLNSKSSNNTKTDQKFQNVWHMFATLSYGSVLLVSFCLGMAVGVLASFLYWHLQNLGGTPILFGTIGITMHVVETIAYFFVQYPIRALGHIGVIALCLVLMASVFACLYLIQSPWLALAIAVVIGVVTAFYFASCTSYFNKASHARFANSAQGIFQGIYGGIGVAVGSIVGGILVTHYGAAGVFLICAIFYTVVLICFVLLQLVIRYFCKQDEEQGVYYDEYIRYQSLPSNPEESCIETNSDNNDNFVK